MARTLRGRRVVLVGYAIVVSLAGAFGFMVGLIGPAGLRTVRYLGLVAFEPTPVGLAVWGMLTVGTALAAGIGLVVAISRLADAERAT